MMKNQIT